MITTKKISVLFLLLCLGAGAYWVYKNFLHWSGWYGKPQSFEQLVGDWAGLGNVPGVILHISKERKPVFVGSAGSLSMESKEAITPDVHFHTASTGKIFTTLTVLKLHEKGLLSLDDPVAPYVDSLVLSELLVVDEVDYSSQITFRHLLTHRSGLPNSDNSFRFQFSILSKPDRSRKPEELIAFARGMSPIGKPDEKTSYSSIGYMLAGMAIEGLTGQPYHEIVRRELLDPLDMTETYESNNEIPEKLTFSHHHYGYIDLSDADPSFEFADGGFVTTADDMAKLGQAIIEGSIFQSDETEAIFLTPLEDGAGFGFYWGTTENGAKYLFQPGFWGVRFVVFPEQELVITFTLNQSNTSAQRFLLQVIELLIDEAYL